ncbi:MAG: hypothetical protein ACLFTH_04280 [Candidatus Woesearchaeota archaeon]
MVRITVDTAQDDASTIRSIITLLNQQLAKMGSRPEHPSQHSGSGQNSGSGTAAQQNPGSRGSAGGAFQHQDTSGLMSMFSDDMPSTDPKNFSETQRPQQQSSQNTWEDSGSFLFGNIEDVAGGEKPSPGQTSGQSSNPDDARHHSPSLDEDDDDDFSVTEYH